MARFTPGTDTAVRSDEPELEIVVTPSSPLSVGRHVFQLLVTDDAGNTSAPALLTVIVRDGERPTAVIDFVQANGQLDPSPAVQIPFGTGFTLTGRRSSDIGGSVRIYEWQLLRP